MGLDIWMACDKCGNRAESTFGFTYNVSPMWHAAVPHTEGGMVDIDGMTGKESIPRLELALTELKKDPEKFEKMNPPNGWGSYAGFVDFLEKLLACAKEHPNKKWQAWR